MTSPTATDLRAELHSGLLALAIDPALASPLLDYLALLERWNRTYNLTSVRDPQAMVSKHLLDSLAMQPFVQDIQAMADLGSGAGLPGIPLALACPQLRVALVEANGKKARFLREAVRTLQIDNARVIEARIEAVHEDGAFDAITARALATLPLILELGGHLLKPEGRLLAMKGARPDEEIAALPMGWAVERVQPLVVPGLVGERHLIVVGRAR